MIVASMCTIPDRKLDFIRSAYRILNEQTLPVDHFHVWLNGYQNVDSELPQDPRLIYHLEPENPGPWIRYRVADSLEDKDILITLDDDTLYPVDYVAKGCQELAKQNDKTVICFSGIYWDPLVNTHSYAQDRWQALSEVALDYSQKVSLHMGQTGLFKVPAVRGAINFELPGFRTNDDMMIGYSIQKRGYEILCLPKTEMWIQDLTTSRSAHALYRRDSGVRQETFRQLITKLGFDPTAGRYKEVLDKGNRILVLSHVCPPLSNSDLLDSLLRQLCEKDTGVHLLASVPSSQIPLVQHYVNTPYEIHTISIPEPGGRLDYFGPVRYWRNWRIQRATRNLWAKRELWVKERLRPTQIYHFDGQKLL